MLAIGSDKSGYPLKEAIKGYLLEQKIDYIEIGTMDINKPVPFYKVAPEAAALLRNDNVDRAILICGTGMGMSQVANKFKGIRAACVESVFAAKLCRAVNDSNVLCMGGWITAAEMGVEMVKEFLSTGFTEGLEEWRKDFLRSAKEEVRMIEVGIYGE